jgi:hypothetical protein
VRSVRTAFDLSGSAKQLSCVPIGRYIPPVKCELRAQFKANQTMAYICWQTDF